MKIIPEAFRICAQAHRMVYQPGFLTPTCSRPRVFGAGATYQNLVLGADGLSPIAYFPMNEVSGTSLLNAAPSGDTLNGVYSNVILANTPGPGASMGNAPYFNGSDSYGNFLTAALTAGFNPSEGTFMVWVKVSDINVWTDGILRYFLTLYCNDNNRTYAMRSATDNSLQFRYTAGGTVKNLISAVVGGSLGWNFVALRWSKSQNRVRATINATTLTPATALGTWSGSLTRAVIGAEKISPSVTSVWKGWLQAAGIWAAELSDDAIAALGTAI